MSLIFDLLSKVKLADKKKDVPLGLKNKIESSRKKDAKRRKATLILISIFILSLGSGFALVYSSPSLRDRIDKLSSSKKAVPSTSEMVEDKDKVKAEAAVKDKQVIPEEPEEEINNGKVVSVKTGEREKAPLNEGSNEVKTGLLAYIADNKNTDHKAVNNSVIAHGEDRERSLPDIWAGKKSVAYDSRREDQVAEMDEGDNKGATTKNNTGYERGEPNRLALRKEREKASYLYTAEGLEKNNDLRGAILAYKKALSLTPDDYKIMNKLASIYINMGIWDEAMKYLEDAMNVKSDYLPVLINAGIVYAKTKRFPDAQAYLIKAISIDKTNHIALFNIALLYELEGRYDEAKRYYQRLKDLGLSEGRKGLKRILNREAKESLARALR